MMHRIDQGGMMLSEIDWTTVPPSHPTCDEHVQVPTLRLQECGRGYPDVPPDRRGQEEIVVQWFGDNDREELAGRRLQFAFTLRCRSDDVVWMGHPEWYRVVMLGPLKNWPNQEALVPFMESNGWTPRTIVVYALTSKIGLDDRKGGTRPSTAFVEVVRLGCSNFGVISPREFADWSVSDEEIAVLAGQKQRQ